LPPSDVTAHRHDRTHQDEWFVVSMLGLRLGAFEALLRVGEGAVLLYAA
jgi:hypothetical protein